MTLYDQIKIYKLNKNELQIVFQSCMVTKYFSILIGCKDSNAKGSLELSRKTRYFLQLPVEQSKTEGRGSSMYLLLKLGPIWFSYFPVLYQLVRLLRNKSFLDSFGIYCIYLFVRNNC